VLEATKAAGAREAYLIQQPLAAAIGAAIPVSEPIGNMVIDIGGGTADAAVVSLGGIVVSESVRVGGMKFDQAIADYVRRAYNLSIGDRTAEEVKITIGSALPLTEPMEMSLRGRDLVAGLPKVISMNTNEVVAALADELEKVVLTVKHVLEKTPPELSADILDHGITMTGGSSLLRNITKLVTNFTGVPCYVAEDAETCVVRGTAIALDNLDAFKRNVYQSK
jgi:rod shape-determining protein MreB